MLSTRRLRTLTACIGALIVTGCSSIEPSVIQPQFWVLRPRAPAGQVCTVRVITLADERADKRMLGTVAIRPVRAPEDTDAWLTSILSGLKYYGVGVEMATYLAQPEMDANAPLQLEVALRAASISTVATAIVGNVELDVRYIDASSREQRSYRGTQTQRNFTSVDREIQRLVDESFDDAMQQMSVDVLRLCSKPGERNP